MTSFDCLQATHERPQRFRNHNRAICLLKFSRIAIQVRPNLPILNISAVHKLGLAPPARRKRILARQRLKAFIVRAGTKSRETRSVKATTLDVVSLRTLPKAGSPSKMPPRDSEFRVAEDGLGVAGQQLRDHRTNYQAASTSPVNFFQMVLADYTAGVLP